MGVAPSTESMAMAAGVWSSFQESKARLLVLPAIAIAGCAAWMMLPGPSDAEGHGTPDPTPVVYAHNISLVEDAAAAAETSLANPTPSAVTAPMSIAPEEKPAIE